MKFRSGRSSEQFASIGPVRFWACPAPVVVFPAIWVPADRNGRMSPIYLHAPLGTWVL
jgi:hypothetical protein